MTDLPAMQNFRTEWRDGRVLHLVFDMPGRSMNVFTNKAIHEIEAFADWLKGADLAGVVVSSGKPGAFCAGADLSELSDAYAMLMAAPEAERDALTVAHFSPIGRAFRKLEVAGKPVAFALHGLALGGGCEFALAGHYRVLAEGAEIGLPESLVGLLPGGGGTQRLPRLVGIEASLPILLEGGRFTAQQALALGAVHAVVAPGDEVAAAEAWVRSGPVPHQPWDRADWVVPTRDDVLAVTGPRRTAELARTGGNFPAEPAILDCLDRGMPVAMDAGVAAEIDVFKDLVQRIEPKNQIAAMFLGRVDHDKRKRKEALPVGLREFGDAVAAAMADEIAALGGVGERAAVQAGIGGRRATGSEAAALAARMPQWFEAPTSELDHAAMRILRAGARVAKTHGAAFAEADRNLVDFHCSSRAGFPAYLGGPFLFLGRYGA
ncbi:MAG: enoyl-CoA hydratase/isomerase family protein [Rhodobacteraceae bacterium]|nr:enoyl-CoA hydratase/isomerase family protein [Paracoccaceae bacterium]